MLGQLRWNGAVGFEAGRAREGHVRLPAWQQVDENEKELREYVSVFSTNKLNTDVP